MSEQAPMLHCGGHAATMEEICAVELPEQTQSYRPVPHGDLVRLIEEEVGTRLGLPEPKRSFGLNREGKQLFGTLVYDLADGRDAQALAAFDQVDEEQAKQHGYAIALRNSYDKSMGLGIAGGVYTFVCDNLALHGSDFTIKLPHTKNVWERAVPQVMVKVRDSVGDFQQTMTFLRYLKALTLSDDESYEVIGVAQGRGVLTPTQAGVAFAEYRQCAKGEGPFAGVHGSAYALYQHFTEALKLGKDVSRRMDKYTGASRLFEERVLN